MSAGRIPHLVRDGLYVELRLAVGGRVSVRAAARGAAVLRLRARGGRVRGRHCVRQRRRQSGQRGVEAAPRRAPGAAAGSAAGSALRWTRVYGPAGTRPAQSVPVPAACAPCGNLEQGPCARLREGSYLGEWLAGITKMQGPVWFPGSKPGLIALHSSLR